MVQMKDVKQVNKISYLGGLVVKGCQVPLRAISSLTVMATETLLWEFQGALLFEVS